MLTDGPFYEEGGCLPTSSLQLCCLERGKLRNRKKKESACTIIPCLFTLGLSLSFCSSLPLWAFCHRSLKSQKVVLVCSADNPPCCAWLCHCAGSFRREMLVLKRKKKCFKDPSPPIGFLVGIPQLAPWGCLHCLYQLDISVLRC